MAPRCEGRIHSVLFRRERCCREAAWSNVTYVRGASKRTAAQRPHLSATSLKLDPGAGLASPRDVSRAAWGGGRMIKPTRSARPVTDQGQLCISARSRTCATRPHQHTSRPRHQNIGRRRGFKTTACEASPPLDVFGRPEGSVGSRGIDRSLPRRRHGMSPRPHLGLDDRPCGIDDRNRI